MSDTTAAPRRSRRGLRAALLVAVTAAFGVLASPAWATHQANPSSTTPVFQTDPTNQYNNPPPNGLCTNKIEGKAGTVSGTVGGVSFTITMTSDDANKVSTFTITDTSATETAEVTQAVVKSGSEGVNIFTYANGVTTDSIFGPSKAGTTGDPDRNGVVGTQLVDANDRLDVSHVCFTVALDPGTGLPVTFQSVSAKRVGGSVVLRWKTSSELDMLGYNVWIERNGKRVKVNKRLIMAKGNAGGSYSATARVPKAKKGPVRMWLEVVNLDGSRTWRLVTAR